MSKSGQLPASKATNQPLATGFEPLIVAHDVINTVKTASLCTIDRNTGHPIATLTNIAFDKNPILLLSTLAVHTSNIASDNRISLLLIKGGKGDMLAHPRITIIGKAVKVEKSLMRETFLKSHPKAALYVDFSDFSFFELEVEGVLLNGGFGRAINLDWAEIINNI
jgi:putative heme iron utilization protein